MGKEVRLRIPSVPTEDFETSRILIFCGATLQKPHYAVRQQISKLHSEIYVSSRRRGSPAHHYGLAPTNFITHVNSVETPDLDEFVQEVSKIEHNKYFRLRVMTFESVPSVVTMKKNDHYVQSLSPSKAPGRSVVLTCLVSPDGICKRGQSRGRMEDDPVIEMRIWVHLDLLSKLSASCSTWVRILLQTRRGSLLLSQHGEEYVS